MPFDRLAKVLMFALELTKRTPVPLRKCQEPDRLPFICLAFKHFQKNIIMVCRGDPVLRQGSRKEQ